MNEMNVNPIDEQLVVVERIDPRFSLSPIKGVLPVCCKLLQVRMMASLAYLMGKRQISDERSGGWCIAHSLLCSKINMLSSSTIFSLQQGLCTPKLVDRPYHIQPPVHTLNVQTVVHWPHQRHKDH